MPACAARAAHRRRACGSAGCVSRRGTQSVPAADTTAGTRQPGHLCPHSCPWGSPPGGDTGRGHGAEGDRREPRPGRSGCRRVLDPHPGQSPGFCRGRPDDRACGRGQPDGPGAGIAYLDPDHHRAPGRAGRVPADPRQSRAGEEHHAGIIRAAGLAVDSQAQDVAAETAAASAQGRSVPQTERSGG